MNDVLEDTPEEVFAQLTQTVERLSHVRSVLKYPDIMIRFAQHMICQQGKNDAANFALLYPLHTRGLEIPEADGFCKRVLLLRLLGGIFAVFQKFAVLFCEIISCAEQIRFAGVQQPPDKLGVLHHDLVT